MNISEKEFETIIVNHLRDVFSVAVRWNAHSVVVAHNHPSGSLQPSKRDTELTRGLYKAGQMMGIPIIDHLILTDKSHYSFSENSTLTYLGSRGH